jgi:iron complex outermembrane receptor protein
VFGGSFNSIGASFDPDKYNSITVTENINRMGFSFKDYSDYYIYSKPGEMMMDSIFHQHKSTDFAVNLFSVSSAIDYKRKFKKKDEELSIDGTYATTAFNRTQNYVTNDYTTPNFAGPKIKEYSPATGNNSTLTAWIDYTDPMFTKNGKLGLGAKSTIYNFTSDNNPTLDSGYGRVPDHALLSKYNYGQQTHAAYANWNDQLDKFSYQAGLRVEDAVYDGHGQLAIAGVHDTSFHNSFFNFFPSAFVSYQLGNQQSIYLNYSRRTNRPGFMQLLPFVDVSNPGTISTGNPALIPEFINNIEFSYSKADNKGNNFIASTYYAYTENLIEKITIPLTAEEANHYGVQQSDLLAKPVNIASGTTYGVEGTGHFQLLPIWDATVNLNFFQNQLIIGNSDPTLTKYLSNNIGFTWFGKVNTNLKLPKNFSFQVNANYESPKVITQGTLKETYWIDLALRKNFWKNKATLILNCSDVLNTHKTVTNYNLPYYDETINRVKETRIGNLTFTYRFGKTDLGKNAGGGKKGKPDDKKKLAPATSEDRTNNMKEGDDNDQGGGGGQGGGQKKDGGGRN